MQYVFTPDINWDALDMGAPELHWLPDSPWLGHFKKGICIVPYRVFSKASPEYLVQLVHRVRLKIRRAGPSYAPIYYRHGGMGRTVELFNYRCEDRMTALAAVQEAFKVATVPGYRRQYVRSEQFKAGLEVT